MRNFPKLMDTCGEVWTIYVSLNLPLSNSSLVTSLIAKWPRLKTSNVWIFIGLLQKWKMAYAFNGNEKESTVNAGLKSSPWFIFPIFQEYERAVIFRLGRLLKSGARGPGVFFIIPCVDHYEKIDMRTQTYDVPPQEVCVFSWVGLNGITCLLNVIKVFKRLFCIQIFSTQCCQCCLIGRKWRVRSCCKYISVLHLPKFPVKKSRVSYCTQKANYLWHVLYWQLY